jgi:hypothetical protein
MRAIRLSECLFMQIRSILSPLNAPPRMEYWRWASAFVFLPFCFDLPLLLRVYAVYPPRTTSRRLIFLLFAFPIAIKVARLAVLILFSVEWRKDVSKGTDIFAAAELTLKKYPLSKVEWSLQIVDNAYVYILFDYSIKSLSFLR